MRASYVFSNVVKFPSSNTPPRHCHSSTVAVAVACVTRDDTIPDSVHCSGSVHSRFGKVPGALLVAGYCNISVGSHHVSYEYDLLNRDAHQIFPFWKQDKSRI